MPLPVSEKVYFNVNFHCLERDGKWIAMTIETGVITVGATEQEAMDRAARWNVFAVSQAKTNGRRALKRYLDRRGISHEPLSGKNDGLAEVAALRNVPLAAMLNERDHVKLAA